MVRWPVRKFARVGRPFRRSASSVRSSGSASSVALPAASPTTSSRIRCSSARCQASRGAGSVSASAASASAAAASAIGCVRASASTATCTRSISSASRPTRSIAPLSTSSSGSTRSNSRCPSSDIVTPSSSRSSPARQVPFGSVPSLNGARWSASSPQRMPLARTHSSSRAMSSSSRPKRRRTGSRSTRSSTCEAVSRSPASSSRRATTPSSGLVWRSDRSASRTRRSGGAPSTGSTSSPPAPNVAWISGANVSMSGHMTITSRGSSVGSSASRCRIASRSTSTWRARPWHEWTWMLRSGAWVSRRSARTSCCTRASRLSAPRSRPRGDDRCGRRRAPAGARASRVPTTSAAGSPRPAGRRDGARRAGGRAAAPTARATGAAGTGARRGARRARAAR